MAFVGFLWVCLVGLKCCCGVGCFFVWFRVCVVVFCVWYGCFVFCRFFLGWFGLFLVVEGGVFWLSLCGLLAGVGGGWCVVVLRVDLGSCFGLFVVFWCLFVVLFCFGGFFVVVACVCWVYVVGLWGWVWCVCCVWVIGCFGLVVWIFVVV